MPASQRLVARRTTLTLGIGGVLAVAGCDLGGADPAPGAPSTTPPADPDAALVDDVLAELSSAADLADAVGSRFPRLTETMTALRRLHEAHIAALDGTPATDTGAVRVPATAPAALVTVRRREQRLQRRLVEAAVAAESGPLARLLASMSAAVSQQLADHPGGAA